MEGFEEVDNTITPEYNLKINEYKCKVLIISKHGTEAWVILNGKCLEIVDEFIDILGNMIAPAGRSRKEMVSRVNLAKAVFN